jgi:hypothetical protein
MLLYLSFFAGPLYSEGVSKYVHVISTLFIPSYMNHSKRFLHKLKFPLGEKICETDME